MKKSLATNGNSWQLYINKPIADLLGINQNEYFINMVVEGKVLYISKVNSLDNNFSLNKKLIKRGSGFGLNFPLPILELLEIAPESDYLDIELQDNKLVIQKSKMQ